MTETQTLQAEIAGDERAIRHLIGERAALNSKLKREQAALKLAEAKLHSIVARSSGPGPAGSRHPDVSVFQPNVDWHVVRSAKSIRAGALGFTKLSEGLTITDGFGAPRLRQMAANGFPHRGGYHFFHPSEDPVAQAAHFLNVAHSHGVVLRESDIVCCDCEVTDGQRPATVAAGVKRFGQELAKHLPSRRWLYGGGPFLGENGVTLDGYHAHWLAAYVGNPAPFMHFGRGRTISWQYTDGVHGPTPRFCPGIGGCDLSIIL